MAVDAIKAASPLREGAFLSLFIELERGVLLLNLIIIYIQQLQGTLWSGGPSRACAVLQACARHRQAATLVRRTRSHRGHGTVLPPARNTWLYCCIRLYSSAPCRGPVSSHRAKFATVLLPFRKLSFLNLRFKSRKRGGNGSYSS